VNDAEIPSEGGGSADRLNFWQRRALKALVKTARKRPGEPLDPSDWEAYFLYGAQPSTVAFKRMLRALPATPRCGFCGAPFAGLGAVLVRRLGYRPSRKNPNVCSTCVELAPPGGMTMEIGLLFADLRGFTSDSESHTPAEVSKRLRRFYAHAEHVLFPEALIDKLIGDEVMALYVPPLIFSTRDELDDDGRRQIATLMLDHARELLERVGYGASGGSEFEVGIGLDFGEAFIGNIGDTVVHDFTAVGDVVNTASRLQGHAAAGEVVLSARLGQFLPEPVGGAERLVLKGKQEPFDARRVRWFPTPASSQ
jgi:adenylate cyclase